VTLVESADGPGGKMRPLVVDGAQIDAGPTVMTMRWVFDEMLSDAGGSAADLWRCSRCRCWRATPGPTAARGWTCFADRQRSATPSAFRRPAAARRFEAFCEKPRCVPPRWRAPTSAQPAHGAADDRRPGPGVAWPR
jgi:1-hydroxycarotenoid 3,4-desaturase